MLSSRSRRRNTEICDTRVLQHNIDKIQGFTPSDKAILKGILRKELTSGVKGGGKKTRNRNSKKKSTMRRKQMGGDGCNVLACVSLLASIIFIGYGITTCVYSTTYLEVLHFALDGFMGAFNIIFGITAINNYRASEGKPAIDRTAAAHAGQWDVVGKWNMIHMYSGKVMGYITKLRTKGISCKTVIPDPLYDFLKIMCEVKAGTIRKEDAKSQISALLTPIQDTKDIVYIDGNEITIQNMQPDQVIKINIQAFTKNADTNASGSANTGEILMRDEVLDIPGLRRRPSTTVSPSPSRSPSSTPKGSKKDD
jgi:hypothetical protein